MKRRQLIDAAAAIALLFGSFAGSANLSADEPTKAVRPTPKQFSVNDEQVAPTSYKSTAATANNQAAANNHLGHGHGAAQDACNECDDYCDGCHGGWSAEFEGLGWWRKSRPLPPLVTTSIPGTLQANAGVLDVGTTSILFGDDNVGDITAGGRLTLGKFFGPEQVFGVGGSFFILDTDDVGYQRAATGINDILAIPFFDAAAGVEDALLLNFPGLTTNGRVNVQSKNDVMGADVYGRYLIYGEPNLRIDAIGGYQFSRIDDSLRINANFDDVLGLPNANYDVTDIFDVRNEFHGGSVGVLAQLDKGRWSIKGMAKCGLGNMRQTVTISGQTINTPVGGGPPAVQNNGLFTQPTNVGIYENDEFVLIPEAKLNFGYRLTQHWTLGAGYSFIYWNDVATAGNVLDRQVNLTQVPGPIVGPARPDFAFGERRDFWAQGFNLSLEFAY